MMRISQFSPLDAEASARLVDASTADEFGRSLLEIARSIAGVDELFGYLVLDGREPTVLVSQSILAGVSDRVSQYVHRFFQHDPAVREIKKIPTGDSFVQRIGLSSIIPYDYRKQCFSDPGFSEKLSFGWRGEGYLLVVSFYRKEAQDREALSKLANLANVTLAVLVRQYAPIDRSNAIDIVEGRLRRAFPKLSDREAQICAFTIIGWPSSKIAAGLGISAGTVLTYRQRAYQKAGVTSAAELVPNILN